MSMWRYYWLGLVPIGGWWTTNMTPTLRWFWRHTGWMRAR